MDHNFFFAAKKPFFLISKIYLPSNSLFSLSSALQGLCIGAFIFCLVTCQDRKKPRKQMVNSFVTNSGVKGAHFLGSNYYTSWYMATRINKNTYKYVSHAETKKRRGNSTEKQRRNNFSHQGSLQSGRTFETLDEKKQKNYLVKGNFSSYNILTAGVISMDNKEERRGKENRRRNRNTKTTQKP